MRPREGEWSAKAHTAKIQDPLDLGAVRTPTQGSTVVISFTATCEQHSTARKQVTRPGKRQYHQQNRLDFIAGKLQRSRANEGLRRTTTAGWDCQVLDLSGRQERISVLEEMRSEVEHWCHLLCTWRHYKRSQDALRGSCRGWSGKPRCRVGLEPHVQPCTPLLQECLDLAKLITAEALFQATAEALFQALAGLLEHFLCPVST